MALVLTGNLKLGVDSGSATEHGDEIIKFAISATVDTVEVPATMSTPTHGRGGANDFAVEIGYLSNDIAGTVFSLLYDNIGATLYFEGSMRVAAVSASNPKWSGTFVVVEAELGGQAEKLSVASAKFPMIAAPTKATS